MSKELPYIDEQGQLHYEAYFGKGRAFLRSSLPPSHPEHLYNYLKAHGIDWTLFFEEDGRRKGIDHEYGPVEKLLGIKKKSSLDDVFGKFPGKERVEYTRSDMERAFAAGGANSAKERVSGNKITLPVLDFNQWMEKFEMGKVMELQARGRSERNSQGKPVIYEIIGDGDMDKMIINLLNGKGTNFLHQISAEVVMLPTNKTSHIYAIEKGGKTTLYFDVNAGNQHLYFLSDGEIKEEGDWYIDRYNALKQASKSMVGLVVDRKIIATTDELRIDKGKGVSLNKKTSIFLPQPKSNTVMFFIACHNVGHPLKDVVIEVDENKNLLIDKDNTVNIATK